MLISKTDTENDKDAPGKNQAIDTDTNANRSADKEDVNSYISQDNA